MSQRRSILASMVATLAGAVLFAACNAPKATAFSPVAIERAAAAGAAVDAASLERHVRAIYAARQGEPAPVSAFSEKAPLARVTSVNYMQSELEKSGLRAVIETGTTSAGPFSNVLADIPGRIPEQVLVTGHLDAWFSGGADDNASALAVILEAARVLAKTAPLRTVRFVAFDREEEGLLGSGAYRARHASDPTRIVLNMDCVGFARHEPDTQDAPPGLGLRDVGDFLAVITSRAGRSDLAGTMELAPRIPGAPQLVGIVSPGDARYAGTGDFLRSDHAPFWVAGVSALFFTDTADFRNANYHTPNDKPDTLDYAFLGAVARFIVATTAAFAEGE